MNNEILRRAQEINVKNLIKNRNDRRLVIYQAAYEPGIAEDKMLAQDYSNLFKFYQND